jgi:hypothetical protein
MDMEPDPFHGGQMAQKFTWLVNYFTSSLGPCQEVAEFIQNLFSLQDGAIISAEVLKIRGLGKILKILILRNEVPG